MPPTNVKDNDEGANKKVQFEVREMEIDDLAQVFHLGEKIFTSEHFPNLYRTWDEFEVVGFFNEEPEFCLVAESEDKILGFALGTTIEKNHSAWKYGHLVWLGVDPEHHRQGIGLRLLNQFRNRMEKEAVRILLVDTDADNVGAIKFFKSMGFGHREEHLYLTANLEAMPRRPVKKKPRKRKRVRRTFRRQ